LLQKPPLEIFVYNKTRKQPVDYYIQNILGTDVASLWQMR